MSRAIVAEYDATENTLRLVEPLKGVSDHAKVRVLVETAGDDARRPVIDDALRRLFALEAPTADIEQMLAEIEAGRR
jgi:hypothetical protein